MGGRQRLGAIGQGGTTRPGLEYKSPYDLVETEEMKKLLEVLNMSPVAADEICLSPKLLSKE